MRSTSINRKYSCRVVWPVLADYIPLSVEFFVHHQETNSTKYSTKHLGFYFEPETHAVVIHDLDRGIFFEVFAKL